MRLLDSKCAAAWLCLMVIATGITADDGQREWFASRVKPLLAERCLSCHGSDRKGGLDLRSRDAALAGGESGVVIHPGDVDGSLLMEYVVAEEMPPGEPLAEDEIAALRRWVDEGVYYSAEPIDPFAVSTSRRAGYDWWSLQPLVEPQPPEVPTPLDQWATHPIDRFIAIGLAESGLGPAPEADRRTLIRRATYDLTGLPPSVDEIEAFVSDTRDDAYEHLIDRLLASPRYGEQWGRHWLDVVRFGESNGYERNVIIPNAWPFRDYVIRSFNEDKPFDQFIREHLAGDVLGPGDPAVEIGTTFLVCGPYDDVGNSDPVQAAQIRADAIDDMIRTTGEAFLGLTLGCARCHDHKFDPVTQRDYYSLYATLAGVFHGSRDVATADEKQARSAQVAPLLQRKSELSQQRSELERAAVERGETQAAELEATWTRGPVSRQGTEERFAPINTRYVRLVATGLDTDPAARTGYRIDEFEVWTAGEDPRNVALAKHGGRAEGASPVAEDFAEAYTAALAIDGEFGAAWIAAAPELTIVLPEPMTIDRVVFSSDRTGAAGDNPVAVFVCEYRIEVSLDNTQWTVVAESSDRAPVHAAHRRRRMLEYALTPDERQRLADLQADLAATDRQLSEIPPLPNWWVGDMRPAPGPFHVFLGGSPQRPGEPVTVGSLAALTDVASPYALPPEAPEAERRRALAQWMVTSDNSLTPRVLANRLWHYHFGRGLVDTPSDFGYMGARPTHPELLDYLAAQLHAAQWRLKPIHRLIMLSRTYRQSSAFDPAAARVDAESRFLWRFPPRRLSAEEIRDTFLTLGDKLAPDPGGPGFRLYRYMQDNVATYVPRAEHGPDTYRRAVYHHNARATRIDLLTDFDSPDCAFGAPRRDVTTTPLQALTLLNHRFTLDMAQALAARIERASQEAGVAEDATPDDPQAAVRYAFHLVLGRRPTEVEQEAAAQLMVAHGLPALCRAMLNSNELIYLD